MREGAALHPQDVTVLAQDGARLPTPCPLLHKCAVDRHLTSGPLAVTVDRPLLAHLSQRAAGGVETLAAVISEFVSSNVSDGVVLGHHRSNAAADHQDHQQQKRREQGQGRRASNPRRACSHHTACSSFGAELVTRRCSTVGECLRCHPSGSRNLMHCVDQGKCGQEWIVGVLYKKINNESESKFLWICAGRFALIY